MKTPTRPELNERLLNAIETFSVEAMKAFVSVKLTHNLSDAEALTVLTKVVNQMVSRVRTEANNTFSKRYAVMNTETGVVIGEGATESDALCEAKSEAASKAFLIDGGFDVVDYDVNEFVLTWNGQHNELTRKGK